MNKADFFKIARILAIVFLHFLVFLIAFLLTMRLMINTGEFPTPDFVGKNIDDCYRLAAQNGIYLKKELATQSGNFTPYSVIAQQPPAGTPIKEGGTVYLTYVSSQRLVKIADYQGKLLKDAETELKKNKLRIGYVSYLSSYEPFNTILAQSIQAEEMVGEKTAIDFLLSNGQQSRSYLMPDFIGKKASQVLLFLEKFSIKVGALEEVPYYGLESGIIIKQFPYPGHELNSKSIVRFQVSK